MTVATSLADSPATIARQLLVDLGLGTQPAAAGAWPVYASQEPDTPDNCITVYATQGTDDGRLQVDGSLQGHLGFQVRIRSDGYETGWQKGDAIQTTLATQVLRETVVVGANVYLVQCVAKIGDILELGKEQGSYRFLFTINAVLSVRQIT